MEALINSHTVATVWELISASLTTGKFCCR